MHSIEAMQEMLQISNAVQCNAVMCHMDDEQHQSCSL